MFKLYNDAFVLYVCPSYPDEVFIPFKVSKKDLNTVSGFRQHQRLPVLCFHHARNNVLIYMIHLHVLLKLSDVIEISYEL